MPPSRSRRPLDRSTRGDNTSGISHQRRQLTTATATSRGSSGSTNDNGSISGSSGRTASTRDMSPTQGTNVPTAGTALFSSPEDDDVDAGIQLNLSHGSSDPPSSLGSHFSSSSSMREMEMLRYRVKELQDTMLGNNSGQGKNSTRSLKKMLSPSDQLNVSEVNNYIGNTLINYAKIFPKKWMNWKNDDMSICQRIMKNVRVPAGSDKRAYWSWLVVKATNDKMCAIRANFKANCRRQFAADRKEGKSLPVEDTKIFVPIRENLKDGYTSAPSYQDVEPFLYFLDKYVSCNYGKRELTKFYKLCRNRTLLDKITVYDIAYTILVYENSRDVWDEDCRYKEMPENEKSSFVKSAKQRHHVKAGSKLPQYSDGWTEDGRTYYGYKLCKLSKVMKRDDVFWDAVKAHWKEYTKKHHSSYYEKVQGEGPMVIDELGRGEDENDEDDSLCNIEIPDEHNDEEDSIASD